MCVAQFDHHCVWSKSVNLVNNCVGYGNYRWFLLFLFTTCVYCFYFFYASWVILSMHQGKHRLAQARLPDAFGQPQLLTFWQQWYYVVLLEPILGALGIFALFSGVIVLCFMIHCLALVGSGVTSIFNSCSKRIVQVG